MPASMQGEMQPTIYRFKFGGFEIANIMDSKVIREGLQPAFGGEQPAERGAGALPRPTASMPIATSIRSFRRSSIPARSWCCSTPATVALRREHEQLRARLPPGHLVERMAPGRLPAGGRRRGGAHARPSRPYRRADRGRASRCFRRRATCSAPPSSISGSSGENVREARKFNRELYVKIVLPLADRASFIKPGDEIAPGIRAVDASGHSPGLLAFISRAKASGC